jgi:hypothetical protein
MISCKVEGIETIANREGVSERSARMGLSLAFLAPDIVQGAVDGILPRGLGVSRLTDMPPNEASPLMTIAGMTELQSNRSPRQHEPVSSRRYATRRGKGILRLETAGGCDRYRPKISVSLGLILHSPCASAGYVGDIQRD